jgi:hypothetical protein
LKIKNFKLKMGKLFSTILALVFVLDPLAGFAQTGIVNNFHVDASLDHAGRSKVASTLRHVSARAHFYVEDNYFAQLTSQRQDELIKTLNNLGVEFDFNIYPTITSIYGVSSDIDNDGRITILITQIRDGIAGYFLPRNQLPRSRELRSNMREMLYLSDRAVVHPYARSHIAHEFVHLVEWNQKTNLRGAVQERWLSEAMADYAPTLLGHNDTFEGSYLQKRVRDFTRFPSSSLEFWRNKEINISTASMFMHYMVGQYGTKLLTEINQNPHSGRESINAALASLGKTENFDSVFTNWHIANFANGTPGERYSYGRPLSFRNLHIPASVRYSMFQNSFINTSLAVQHTAALWVKFVPGALGLDGSNTLRVDFDAADSEGLFKVPYIQTDIRGKTTVGEINLSSGRGSHNFYNFGTDILSVVLVAANHQRQNGSTSGFFNLRAVLADKQDLNRQTLRGHNLADGALIRAVGDTKVYVIKGNTKRWIPSEKVFNGYGHLRWQDVVEVGADALARYTESRLVKFAGDYRVYQINAAGNTKQWLNITPAQFDASGRAWNAIYEINRNEFDWYATGAEINK